MAYVILAIGLALAYLDWQGLGQVQAAGSLLYSEMFKPPAFYKWAGAFIILLAVGYIPEMEPIALSFMVLALVVLIMSNSSGFTSLIKAA